MLETLLETLRSGALRANRRNLFSEKFTWIVEYDFFSSL